MTTEIAQIRLNPIWQNISNISLFINPSIWSTANKPPMEQIKSKLQIIKNFFTFNGLSRLSDFPQKEELIPDKITYNMIFHLSGSPTQQSIPIEINIGNMTAHKNIPFFFNTIPSTFVKLYGYKPILCSNHFLINLSVAWYCTQFQKSQNFTPSYPYLCLWCKSTNAWYKTWIAVTSKRLLALIPCVIKYFDDQKILIQSPIK